MSVFRNREGLEAFLANRKELVCTPSPAKGYTAAQASPCGFCPQCWLVNAAAVNGQGGRKILMEPLRERLFFAGEAVHETLWGTVGGAWASGDRAAQQALRKIGAISEPPPEPQRQAPEPRRRRR